MASESFGGLFSLLPLSFHLHPFFRFLFFLTNVILMTVTSLNRVSRQSIIYHNFPLNTIYLVVLRTGHSKLLYIGKNHKAVMLQ